MEKRKKWVSVAFSEKEKENLETIADEIGIPPSTYVRMLVIKHLKQMKGRESQSEESKKV
nr:MAG TPA: antitoxin [Caudoviricetes sp.]